MLLQLIVLLSCVQAQKQAASESVSKLVNAWNEVTHLALHLLSLVAVILCFVYNGMAVLPLLMSQHLHTVLALTSESAYSFSPLLALTVISVHLSTLLARHYRSMQVSLVSMQLYDWLCNSAAVHNQVPSMYNSALP